jgi:NTE family protein
MSDAFLASLAAAGTPEERAWLFFEARMEGLDEALRAALFAACIPHRLDGSFLAALQQSEPVDALDELVRRGFATRDRRGYRLPVGTRRHLLARLCQTKDRFETLNRRAAAYLASLGRDDADRYAAYVYHAAAGRGPIVRAEDVLAAVRESFPAWGGSPDFAVNAAAAIPRLLAEAVEVGRYPGPLPETRELWVAMLDRSTSKTRVALALGGAGALSAYHAGVYNALHDAGIEPDWIAGESMGALIGAVIAGNTPERRLSHLGALWSTFAQGAMPVARPFQAMMGMGQWVTMAFGIPGLFRPNMISPLLGGTAYYDLSPARDTLERLVDFDLLNHGPIRYAVSAVNVATGNFTVFDNRNMRIIPDHVLASMASPPAFAAIEIDGNAYWGAALVSSAALQDIFAGAGDGAMVVYQPYLFVVSDRVPTSLAEVQSKQQAITYISRARLIADYYANLQRMRGTLRRALERLPEDARTQDDRALLADLVSQPRISLVNLVYRQHTEDINALNYNFDRDAIAEHWQRGRDDAARALGRGEASPADEESGITITEVDEGPR